MELDVQLQEPRHVARVAGVAHGMGNVHQLQAQRRRRVLGGQLGGGRLDGGAQLGK